MTRPDFPPERLIVRGVNLALERPGEHGGLADCEGVDEDGDHIHPT